MLTFHPLTPQDRDLVLPMVTDFYHTDAVLHPVDAAILEQSFQDAADPDEPLLQGFLLRVDDVPAGYLYLTQCYSAEVGGRCVFVEEIYLKPEFRGRRLGQEVMAWIEAQYPSARRFRLEVTPVNRDAIRLYERAGYQYLRYEQMILDK
jgi:ribosomal protein S18 acetylase RimI-like enzyme